MFKKILIANRGEIALRVIRACRELQIPCVAVCSDADRTSLHVQMADEAVCLGPAAPLESYLNIKNILEAAANTGADAVHPGYGFLAENYRFAAACKNAGYVFIGPESRAIKLLGDKLASRRRISKSSVPLIPGMQAAEKSLEDFRKSARNMGYPVMIKAAAGGGGKGMRIVQSPAELKAAVEAGRRESGSAFGDDTVYLEKCINNPRHVEFQVLADTNGNAVHLCERECSLQRRHQKIVEETPSAALDRELRQRMGEAAVSVVKTTGYTNAGTVEFLLDDDGNFYFLEVNTRIQVEHPITEMVTGVDLVQWQIRIAAGEPLTLRQEDIEQRGHAIECRIYAEDASNQFLPSLGRILYQKEPQGPGIRVDSGIYSGWEVTRHYDPILSKLIAWGQNREISRQRMINALREYVILGVTTTIPFLIDVIDHPAFIEARTDTGFIPTYFPNWKPNNNQDDMASVLIAAALYQSQKTNTPSPSLGDRDMYSPWQNLGEWSQ